MKKVFKKIFPLIFFVIFSSSLFWPIFIGKIPINGNLLVSAYPPYSKNLPFKHHGWDQLRIYYPFQRETFIQLKNFQIPLWNNHAFSGHPHLADFQSAVLYPMNIFGLFLSQNSYWNLLTVSPLVLGAFFTYLFLRKLNLDKIPSIFGGFTFGFSPFMITWGHEVIMSPHSIIFLPLILYAFENYIGSNKKKYLFIISLSTMSTFFAGYMQTTIYLFIFSFLYFLYRLISLKKLNVHYTVSLVGAVIAGTMLAAPQILPSAEIFFQSARSQVTLKEILINSLIPTEGLLTYLAPDIFGNPSTLNQFRQAIAQYYESIMFIGIAPIIFMIYALISKNKLIFAKLSLSKSTTFFYCHYWINLPVNYVRHSHIKIFSQFTYSIFIILNSQ